MSHPSFIVERSKGDHYHFNLTAKNAQVILTSQQYTTKAACLNGVESVKTNASDDAHYERLTSKNDKFYFVIKAANKQVIGNSQMYTTESARDNGIQSVKENAPVAKIDDRIVD